MVVNINEAVAVCGINIHVHSISINTDFPSKKTYYQHRHPSLEIHYIINGECQVTYNRNSITIPAETMLLIPPETYHDVSPTCQNTTRLCLSFSIPKKKSKIINSKTEILNNTFNQNAPIIAQLNNRDVQVIIDKTISLLTDNKTDVFKNEKLLALCASLLFELIPYFAVAAPCDHTTAAPAQEDVSFKIDSFLGRNFMYNDAKSRMAENLYISPRQLQRVIRKNYGMNYRQKLAETRMQIAIDLLYNSNKPIHKIAEILGYSCSANFSAFIKRATGKTPSQIRKER